MDLFIGGYYRAERGRHKGDVVRVVKVLPTQVEVRTESGIAVDRGRHRLSRANFDLAYVLEKAPKHARHRLPIGG